jgi:hypothetical protein
VTVISDNIKNIAQVPSGSSVWFSTDLRTTATGIVESKQFEARPDAQGNITADLTPGPAALLIPPDSPVELLQTAVELYLQENPIEGGGDLTKAVADQTYAPLWVKETAVDAGAMRILPDGSIGTRTTAGTTRPTFDATESALWTRTTASGGGYDGGTL